MKEPVWIAKDVALSMHARQLAEHGGGEGVRDEGLLESALARAQNLFLYADKPVHMTDLAASYAYGLATNHPFVDGNKRTALVVSQTFLSLNDHNFSGSFENEYKIFIQVANGTIDEEQLAAWFKQNSSKISE